MSSFSVQSLISLDAPWYKTIRYSTYAIYRASTNINGTIKAANWSVKVKKTGATGGEGTPISSATLTFTAADIDWTSGTHTGKNDTIAPGDVG